MTLGGLVLMPSLSTEFVTRTSERSITFPDLYCVLSFLYPYTPTPLL